MLHSPEGEQVQKSKVSWRNRANELRRLAETAVEVERQRKMLVLAEQFEEAAEAERPGEESRPVLLRL